MIGVGFHCLFHDFFVVTLVLCVRVRPSIVPPVYEKVSSHTVAFDVDGTLVTT